VKEGREGKERERRRKSISNKNREAKVDQEAKIERWKSRGENREVKIERRKSRGENREAKI
jgi:hypothetical protein